MRMPWPTSDDLCYILRRRLTEFERHMNHEGVDYDFVPQESRFGLYVMLR